MTLYSIEKNKQYKIVGENTAKFNDVREIAEQLKIVKDKMESDEEQDIWIQDSNISIRNYNAVYDEIEDDSSLAEESRAVKNEVVVK